MQLTPSDPTKPAQPASRKHVVQFYEDEVFMGQTIAQNIDDDLRRGDAVIFISTAARHTALMARLERLVPGGRESPRLKRLHIVDADLALGEIMRGGLPDPPAFHSLIGALLERASAEALGVRVYGEMVDVLLSQNNVRGMLALDALWDDMAKHQTFSLTCSYVVSSLHTRDCLQALAHLGEDDGQALPTRRDGRLAGQEQRLHLIAELHEKAAALETLAAGRRQVEKSLQASEERIAALRLALKAAEDTTRRKSEYLAGVSHEIRTPLGAILGFSELLRGEELSAADRQHFLDTITRNGRELNALVDDILDLSKVEAGMLDINKEFFSLPELLQDVAATLAAKIGKKGLELTIRSDEQVPAWIHSDSSRLRQILLNVVGNAVKFTARGTIKIQVQALPAATKGTPGTLRFLIEDTGPGLTAKDAANLFQPFYQARSGGDGPAAGTGLGLVLSRQLARLLGGDVDLVRSRSCKGSVFKVDIELEAAPPRLVHTTPSEEPRTQPARIRVLERVRILFVDDCEDNRDLIRFILASKGAQVDVAENGENAIKMAMQKDYDLILMDIQMPVLDGYQATEKLREMGFTKPIIALTAHAMRSDQQKCLDAGCDEHLAKPIETQCLIATVSRYVNKNVFLHTH